MHPVINRMLARLRAQRDPNGGIIPADIRLAKKHGLVTFAPGINGARCSDCKYLKQETSFCPVIKSAVEPDLECCNEYDKAGTFRAYKG